MWSYSYLDTADDAFTRLSAENGLVDGNATARRAVLVGVQWTLSRACSKWCFARFTNTRKNDNSEFLFDASFFAGQRTVA